MKAERIPDRTTAKTIDLEGNYWPTSEQELLLRAAFLSGNDALVAWREWKPDGDDVDQLDAVSYRLLPQLYHNLHLQGVRGPLLERLKGIYRQTWYKNQILFHSMAALIRSFHNSGIQTMILQGGALVLLYYKDYGLRPTDDFAVLVHTEDAPAAMNLLKKLGWTPRIKAPETFIPIAHSITYRNDAGRQFDLHWRVLPECGQENANGDFWNGAKSVQLDDVRTCALNPTDQLLQVCVRGAEWGREPPFVWVADALTILNSSQSEIDWSRMIAQARKHRLILSVKDTLRYLKAGFDSPIPQWVFESAESVPTSTGERIERAARIRRASLWGVLPILWFQYQRSADGASLPRNLIGFPKYLRYAWGLQHLWQIPIHAALKTVGRLWQ